ncbi:hypothetical protein ABPG72_000604 [Tetrahymena utriculariae]
MNNSELKSTIKNQEILNALKLDSANLKKSIAHNFIVDSESGPYKTIQEAIDAAEPGSTIKIAPGLYNDNIYINKPDLTLEPKEKVGDIILVVQNKPAIRINLQPGQSCKISSMKLSHSGTNENIEEIERLMQEKEFTLNLFGGGKVLDGITQYNECEPDLELVNKFPIEPDMNCILFVEGGELVMEKCLLSLNFIISNNRNILPAVIVTENGKIDFSQVEIKGNINHETIGVILRKGNAKIDKSKIYGHLFGGIAIWSNKNNVIKITNSKIYKNSKIGIHCVGEDGEVLIEGNKIENNNGSGIKIGIANKTSIIKNEIKQNQVGVEVISGEPFIFSNKIDKNYTDGILTNTFDKIRCDAIIKNNLSICRNNDNGIHCKGINNYTKIELNSFVAYNKKAGIKVDEEATVSIFKNKVLKNFTQGILLVESSSAVIEQNEIKENIKANIAMGGANAINTCILKNIISGGRCEGIFIIESGNCWIKENNIQDNNDGIVCITSLPEISFNDISKNKSNGIMVMKDSRPSIVSNIITDNDGIGLFIRDKSWGKIKDNTIKSNEIELVLERKNDVQQSILSDNSITGDIRLPQGVSCNIF